MQSDIGLTKIEIYQIYYSIRFLEDKFALAHFAHLSYIPCFILLATSRFPPFARYILAYRFAPCATSFVSTTLPFFFVVLIVIDSDGVLSSLTTTSFPSY